MNPGDSKPTVLVREARDERSARTAAIGIVAMALAFTLLTAASAAGSGAAVPTHRSVSLAVEFIRSVGNPIASQAVFVEMETPVGNDVVPDFSDDLSIARRDALQLAMMNLPPPAFA
ncbi:MAG: hypothetical protein AAGB34_08145 [Planctomycetota bacterium]